MDRAQKAVLAAAVAVGGTLTCGTGVASADTTSSGAVCSIRSNAGHCYRAGEYCRDDDQGKTTTDADGRAITCLMESGGLHWHY
jgi:hypothetical protein